MLIGFMGTIGERLQPLAWALGVAIAARIPLLSSHVPGLAIFASGFGLLVIGLALIVALAPSVSLSALARIGPVWLFAASALLSATLGLYYIRELQATGDEPEYLLMAQSLWKEHDLDLADNWARGDFKEYVPGMPDIPHGTTRLDGRPISTHSPGLPALLAPIYALGGRSACVLAFALAGAALALQVRALALKMTDDAAASFVVWAAAAGPPVLPYTFHLYTEVPSALAAATTLRLLLAEPGPGPAAAALAALLVSLLPWLHVKLIALAAALGLIAVWRLRGRALVAFLVVTMLMAAGFVGYYEAVFGTPTPLGLYGGRVPKGLREAAPLHAGFGLFLDRAYGLLPYAPVFLLALSGVFVFVRRAFRNWAPWLLCATAVLVPILRWRTWFGGFCPPARFLVPMVPMLGVFLAVRLAGRRYGLARWTLPCVAFGYVSMLIATRVPRDLFLLHAKYDAPRMLERLMGSEPALRYLPSFTWGSPQGMVAWSVLLGVLIVLDRAAERSARVDRLFATPALPLGLFLLTSAAIDLAAR